MPTNIFKKVWSEFNLMQDDSFNRFTVPTHVSNKQISSKYKQLTLSTSNYFTRYHSLFPFLFLDLVVTLILSIATFSQCTFMVYLETFSKFQIFFYILHHNFYLDFKCRIPRKFKQVNFSLKTLKLNKFAVFYIRFYYFSFQVKNLLINFTH